MTIQSSALTQKPTRPSKIAIAVKELYPQTATNVRGQQFAEMADDADGSD